MGNIPEWKLIEDKGDHTGHIVACKLLGPDGRVFIKTSREIAQDLVHRSYTVAKLFPSMNGEHVLNQAERVRMIDRKTYRNKNRQISNYNIVSEFGYTVEKHDSELKELIRSGRLIVENLTLTSDDRLMKKKLKDPCDITITLRKIVGGKIITNTVNLSNIIMAAMASGGIITRITSGCYNTCYIITNDKLHTDLLLIPDNIFTPPDLFWLKFNNTHTLRAIGGVNLTSTKNLFRNCQAKKLDIIGLDTSKVKDMQAMFSDCKSEIVGIEYLNTDMLELVDHMFYGFNPCVDNYILDVSHFNLSRVKRLVSTFALCNLHTIKFGGINTKSITDLRFAFAHSSIDILDLGSFDTSNVTGMQATFSRLKAQRVNLSSLDTSNVSDMADLFESCNIDTLDIRNFDFSRLFYMDGIFRFSQINKLIMTEAVGTDHLRIDSFRHNMIKNVIADKDVKALIEKYRNAY